MPSESTIEQELSYFFMIVGCLQKAKAAMNIEDAEWLIDDLAALEMHGRPVISRRAAVERKRASEWLTDATLEQLTGEVHLVAAFRTDNVRRLDAPRPLN